MADSFREWSIPAALALAWVVAAFVLVGRLKQRRRWRTGDTRSLFHLRIFGGAALVQWRAGFAAACTLVEAVAPHGWDDPPLQIAASAAACAPFPI